MIKIQQKYKNKKLTLTKECRPFVMIVCVEVFLFHFTGTPLCEDEENKLNQTKADSGMSGIMSRVLYAKYVKLNHYSSAHNFKITGIMSRFFFNITYLLIQSLVKYTACIKIEIHVRFNEIWKYMLWRLSH